MKKGLLIISLLLLIFGCRKDQDIAPKEETSLPSYIKNLIQPDSANSYEGRPYVHVSYINNATSEIYNLSFDEGNSSMALRYDSSIKGAGLSEQTVMFINAPTGERLEISFYYDLATDTAFVFRYADYLYGDTWNERAGVNIQYGKPVGQEDESRYLIYRGVNDQDSYFRITHLGNGSVNGIFHTTWQECCGEPTTYDVTGDFSIPLMSWYFAI